MHSISHTVRRTWPILAAAAVLLAACHGNTSNTSGYGVAWVTLGSVPSPIFTSYVVTVDSVTLTDTLGNTYTALSTPEPVDFVKLRNYREIWGSGTIPNTVPGSVPVTVSPPGYVSATLLLDYTNAAISVLVNGVPQRAAVVGTNGSAVTTMSVKVNLDPAQPLVIQPSYSTDNAQMLAFNFDLPASSRVDLTTSPATVTVRPFITAALGPPDNELIRVRGPLVNSSVPIGTFTVYERPFYDQASSLGSLTIFNNEKTLYTVDGVSYAGTAGLNQLSQTPAGITVTESYTTFEPTQTATAYAGKFNSVYTIGGNSVSSVEAENISGDVIAIATNATTGVSTLTLRGATVYGPLVGLAEGYFGYQDTDAQLLVGPNTVVTVDDATTAGLNYKSIAVGAHVEALGAYTCTGTCGTTGTGVWTIDATSASTGKVRLQQTQVFGQLLSASAGSLSMDLQTINDWPASDFNFAGNGTTPANDPSATNFVVATGAGDFSTTPTGTPLWIDGMPNRFGAAPPDFLASSVNQLAAMPAQLVVAWARPAGTISPFASLAGTGFTINLQDPNLTTAILQIGPQVIALNSLSVNPQIVTTATPISITSEPVFSPHYAFSTVATVSAITTTNVSVFTNFSSFVTNFVSAISLAAPAYQLSAGGYYDSVHNQFIANTVSVVL
ncbi:MAG: hypothetical protein ACHQIL_08955 [Steroidobacterales bacterium]